MSVGSIDEQQFDGITTSFPGQKQVKKERSRVRARDKEILTQMTLLL